jgi:hypothetical protein
MAEKIYTKLAGKGTRPGHVFTWYTLWEGPDHVLQIETSGYTEEYKRFFFNDIQSIALRTTTSFRNYTIFFLSVAGLGAAAALSVSSIEARIFWYIWIGFFGSLLLVHLIKGPTCAGHIKTAVQQEQLPSLKRLRKSRKVVARIRERIAATQGLYSADDILARFNETIVAPAPVSVPRPMPPIPGGDPPLPPSP